MKSTLASIPIHVMQMFKLPEFTLKTIDKISRNFLWNSTDIKRKIHSINWKTVCMPIPLGGLGITTAKNRNISLLKNIAWRHHTINKD